MILTEPHVTPVLAHIHWISLVYIDTDILALDPLQALLSCAVRCHQWMWVSQHQSHVLHRTIWYHRHHMQVWKAGWKWSWSFATDPHNFVWDNDAGIVARNVRRNNDTEEHTLWPDLWPLWTYECKIEQTSNSIGIRESDQAGCSKNPKSIV